MLGQRQGGGRDPNAQLRGFWRQQPAGSGRHRHGGGKQGLGETERDLSSRLTWLHPQGKGQPRSTHPTVLDGNRDSRRQVAQHPQTLNPFWLWGNCTHGLLLRGSLQAQRSGFKSPRTPALLKKCLSHRKEFFWRTSYLSNRLCRKASQTQSPG